MPRKKSAADRIRAEIRSRGWTAYRLSKETGIPYQTAIRFMARRNVPSFPVMERLIEAIDWTIGPTEGSRP